jgi:Big-like domain-containing protein
MAIKLPDGLAPQASDVFITGLVAENPAGEQIDMVNGITIPIEDCYQFYALVENMGPDNAWIKPHLDLYEKSSTPIKDLLYSTSFEDNYDVYNNWIQVDGDCGVMGGHYDSWVISDARASPAEAGGDFSFHSTMYGEYKSCQDDYLETTAGYDLAEYDFVEVKFDIWVEGEYEYNGYYQPFDYLDFEVWDDGDWYNPVGLTLYNPDAVDSCDHYAYPNFQYNQMWFVDSQLYYLLPGVFYFPDTTVCPYDYYADSNYLQFTQTSECHIEDIEIGGGWWQVQCTLPIGWFYDPTAVDFRFSWHTDVENQFEGAYVDNVRIFGFHDVNTKIFQTHSQGQIEWDMSEYAFEFPLEWCDVELGNYMIKLWVENHAGDTQNNYNDSWIIDFTVIDDIDCDITDLIIEDSFTQVIVPDGGTMTKGADAHIVYEFHNDGNLPVSDVEIVATAQKMTWEEDYSTDFEGMAWSDTGTFDGPQLWHKTSFDAWSGSSCLANFNKDTRHYENNMYYNYVFGPTVDMEGVLDCQIDYYAKWITEYYGDSYWFLLMDASTNYVLRCGSPYSFDGFQPTWIGPMQPQGIYQPFDMGAYYNLWYSMGMFHNCDGSQAFDVGFGFTCYATDGDTYTNAQAEEMGVYWSGMMIDDVTVTKQVLDDPVWTDTMIIPETIEPCDTYTAQFEWEDVPYSCYRITVAAICDEAAGCCPDDDNSMSSDFCVYDDLEIATDPKVESCDLTDIGDGEWVISDGGQDFYMATQSGATSYGANANQIAQLCPEHGGDCDDECPGCSDACGLDISHLYGVGTPATPVALFMEDFELFGIPPTWLNVNLGTGIGWYTENYASPTAYVPSGGSGALCAAIDSDNSGSGANDVGFIVTPPIDLTAGGTLTSTIVDLDYQVNFQDFASYADYGEVWLWDLGTRSLLLQSYTNTDVDAHEIITFDSSIMIDPTTAQIEFFYDDMGSWVWSMAIDDVALTGYMAAVGAPGLQGLITYDIWYDTEWGWDYVFLEVCDDYCGDCDEFPEWTIIDAFSGWAPYDYAWDIPWAPWQIPGTLEIDPQGHVCGWIRGHSLDLNELYLAGIITGDTIGLRFRFVSDGGVEYTRGVRIDNFIFEDLFDVTEITDPAPVFEDFVDDFEPVNDLDNWCTGNLHMGQFWETTGPTSWCTDGPAGLAVLDALVWNTEIADAYEAVLTVTHDYDFAPDAHGTVGYIQVSADGGVNWFTLDYVTGIGSATSTYDLTPWSGNDILIRFLVDGSHAANAGYTPTAWDWCVYDIMIKGKRDTTPPMTEISMTGQMTDAGWYSSVVQVTITAVDDAAMGEIHYILDGQETVVQGDRATFTVSENGVHNIEYWGVDATGNVETHHTVPTFRIDSGAPPTVAITAPEPGLYLFGNKLLSASKVFIIGAFNIEATASDDESGVYRVQFYLDGDLISEDTEVPFSAYCAQKHMGAGTIKVIAEDFSGNSAEDTLDITYYKFL